MITATAILQKLRLLYEEWAVAKVDPKKGPISISENPSSFSEVMRDLKDDIRDPDVNFRQEPLIRFLYDPQRDLLLAWCAAKAIHRDFSKSRSDVIGTIDASRKLFFTQSFDSRYTPEMDADYPRLRRFEVGLTRVSDYADVRFR
jgi:hypothetical protein